MLWAEQKTFVAWVKEVGQDGPVQAGEGFVLGRGNNLNEWSTQQSGGSKGEWGEEAAVSPAKATWNVHQGRLWRVMGGSPEPTHTFQELNWGAWARETRGKNHTGSSSSIRGYLKVSQYLSSELVVLEVPGGSIQLHPQGWVQGWRCQFQGPRCGQWTMIKKPSAFQLGALLFLRDTTVLQLQKGAWKSRAGSRDLSCHVLGLTRSSTSNVSSGPGPLTELCLWSPRLSAAQVKRPAFFRPWDQEERREGGTMVWEGVRERNAHYDREAKGVILRCWQKRVLELGLLLLTRGQARLQRVLGLCYGLILTAWSGDLSSHGVYAVKTIPITILRYCGPFRSHSLAQCTTDFPKAHVTCAMTTAPMQKVGSRQSLIKPDPEETWEMHDA